LSSFQEYPTSVINNIQTVLYNNLIDYNENDPDRMLYQIYNDLTLSHYVNEINNPLFSFIYLLNALEKPILTTEVNIIYIIICNPYIDRVSSHFHYFYVKQVINNI